MPPGKIVESLSVLTMGTTYGSVAMQKQGSIITKVDSLATEDVLTSEGCTEETLPRT